MSDGPQDEFLGRVPIERRTLLRRLVVGTAFAVPVVSSFSMSNLSMNMAGAQQSNQSSP